MARKSRAALESDRMRISISKATVKVAVAPLAAAGASFALPPAANAAGSCTNYGFNKTTIGVCVNDHNTQAYAYSDFYVNGPFPGNCLINMELWDTSGTKYNEVDNLPCH